MKSIRIFLLLCITAFTIEALLFGAQAPPPKHKVKVSSQKIFKQSQGYKALRAKQYDQALREIEKLLKHRKNDPYLLKMKGIVLLLMKRRDEAEKNLQKALEINPKDRQARLYLAKIHLRNRQPEQAKKELYFIIQNPDPSHYFEDKAQRALATIEGRMTPQPSKKQKRWFVYGTYGYEYDDNVPLKSDLDQFKINVDRNANRFKLQNGFSYDYLENRTKKFGISYFFSQSLHTDGLYGFNFENHALQNYANYFRLIFGKPTTMGLKHVFSHGSLGDSTFSSSNSFLGFASIQFKNNLAFSLYDNIAVTNFRDKGVDKGVTSRDGLYNTTGIMSTFYFSKKRRSLAVSYEFGYNNTVGDNFDARAEAGRVTFRSPLIEKIIFETTFSAIDDNHYNFASKPHREDIRFDYSVRLSRPIGKWFEVRAFYSYTKADNTHAGILGSFSYNRNILGTEIAFRY